MQWKNEKKCNHKHLGEKSDSLIEHMKEKNCGTPSKILT